MDREKIIEEAIHRCYTEMYAKAQPSANYDKLIQDKKEGKIDEDKDGPVYNRHYLSFEEHDYIINKYIESYRLKCLWEDYVEVVEHYLKEGGKKDADISETFDEKGNSKTSYRGFENVKPIIEQIKNILEKNNISNTSLSKEITDCVMKNIQDCKNFYRFDNEEKLFRCAIALGHSPTSNKKTVIEWWKKHENKDIEIEERIPELFWFYDEGYTDEDLAFEFQELGEKWKETLYNKWQKTKNKKS